MEHTSCKL